LAGRSLLPSLVGLAAVSSRLRLARSGFHRISFGVVGTLRIRRSDRSVLRALCGKRDLAGSAALGRTGRGIRV
jgi:hypothetical protein